MTEPLLGCDPTEVTPARAGAVFAQEASRMCKDEGIDLTAAWNKTKLLHPELHARMCEKPASAAPATLANDLAPVGRVPIASKSLLLPAFNLGPLTSDEDFSTAYAANSFQSVRVDAKKTWLALLTAIMKKQSCTVDVAKRQLQEDQPALARAAGQQLGAS